MDSLNLDPSVWPSEDEDDPGLRRRGGMNSGLPPTNSWVNLNTSSLDRLDYSVPFPTFPQVPPLLPDRSQLEQEITRLRIQNAELSKENESLKAQCNASKNDVNPLGGSQDMVETDVAPPQLELEQRDFPNVKFWFKRSWTKMGSESNVFFETEQGDAVDDERVNECRKHARKFFHTIDSMSKIPSTWKQAPTEMRHALHKSLVDAFPELRLCHNNWKVDQVVSLTYTSWHNYWVKRLLEPPKTTWKKTRSSMLNRFNPVSSPLDRDNIGLGLQAMTGQPTVLMPGSEPIGNGRYGRAPQAQAGDSFALSNPFNFEGMGPHSSEPIVSGSAFAYGHAPQAEDSFAPSNAFLDFEGMGPHSSEPIAGSSAFAYGQAPQAEDSFALSNPFDFEGMGPHSSEPIASGSAFAYGRAPQGEDAFPPSNTSLYFQGMGLPASNNLMSLDEWKVYGKHSSEKRLANE